MLLFLALTPSAQTQRPPDQAAIPDDDPGLAYDTFGYANVFVGPMLNTGGGGTRVGGTSGVTAGLFHVKPLTSGAGVAPVLELGLIGPIPHGHSADGMVSLNGVFETFLPNSNALPFLTAGFTRIFATGNALNFGIGFDHGIGKSDRMIRFELRDYYQVSGTQQHLIVLRVALGSLFSDSD
jgi:hypothetical protein